MAEGERIPPKIKESFSVFMKQEMALQGAIEGGAIT